MSPSPVEQKNKSYIDKRAVYGKETHITESKLQHLGDRKRPTALQK